MKKFVVFLLFLLPLMAKAGPIDLESAKRAAGTFLKEKVHSKTIKPMNLAYRQSMPGHEDQTACYVFNASDGKGYVVVSGDDRTEQVLGYSPTGHIDPTAMPDNMKYYLDELAKEIASIKGNVSGGSNPMRRAPTKKAIAPLITTHWDQDSPFFNMTPTVTNNNGTTHCVTGCVATALAQLMNFYKYPNATIAEIPGYTSESYGFKLDAIPAGTAIDWNNMVDTYNSSSTTAQCNAVAKLMYLCGVSMKMDYGPYSSGASISPNALIKYFGYGSQVQLCEKADYTSFEWFNLIYEELAKGYPMYSDGGSHAYIIDGYDGDCMFHFNWGWGPGSDGYYLLSAVSEYYPEGGVGSTTGYTSGQRVLTGLRTTSAESPKIESIVKLDSQVDNNTLKVEVTHPARLAEESAFGIGYMKDDRSVVPISVCYEEWPYYSNGTIILSYPFTIRGLSKGNYKVVAIKKDEGSSVWKTSEDTGKSFADVNVDGNGNVTTTLYGYTKDIKVDTMVFVNDPTFGSNRIKAYVSKNANDGKTFDGDISLYAIEETPIGTNGLRTTYYNLDTKSVILKKDETKSLDFSAFISGIYYGASDADSLFTFRFCQGDFRGKELGDFKVLVKKSPKISRNLAMTMTPTIESFNTSQNYLYGKSLKMKVQVVNENDSDYVGYVQARAYIGNTYSWDDRAICLPAGSQTEVEFDLWSEGFPNDASSCRLELKNWCWNGVLSFSKTECSTFEPLVFNLQPGIKVFYENGTSKCFEATSSYSAPKNATAIDIRGQNTLKSLTRANPNCLVFTDDKSGTPSGVTTNIVKSSKSDNITLTDGYSFATPEQFTATNISYTRTFTKAYRPNGTGWTTICLPFDVTSVKVKNGSTSTAIDWFHSSTDTGKSFWVREFSEEDAPMIRFAPASKMLAAHPYIISFPDANSGIGKTLTGKPVTFYGSQAVIKPSFRSQTLGYTYRMKGVTSSSTINLGFGHNDGDTLFVKNSPLSVPAFRAYFEPVTSGAQTRARLILAGEKGNVGDDPLEQEESMELVDLGLSVKWANKNLGAKTAERPGQIISWGELTPKSYYSLANYEYYQSYSYCWDIGSDISGTQYDVAYTQSGGKYRMPTRAEMQELIDRCTITNEIVNGVDGFRVKGPNGNSIFMPASGFKEYYNYVFTSDESQDNKCGFYWTSEPYNSNSSKYAYSLIIGTDGTHSITNSYRCDGLTIRPVEATDTPVVPVEPEAVDLGLSTNWATFNVGATIPEASGKMVAWGETEPKSSYTWENYTYCNGTASSVQNIGNEISGTGYDIATEEWGDDWRMPTQKEIKELRDKCTFTNTVQNGVKGCTVTGPNGNSIFLPFSGCSYNGATYGKDSYVFYWSGTLDGSNNQKANSLYVTSSSGATISLCQRRTGVFVRPVKGHNEIAEVEPEEVDLGLSTTWASFNLGATSPSEAGDMVAWGETEPKSSYTWENYTYCNGTASSVQNIGNEISDTEYDAAANMWGDGWRMPTREEINELRTKCTFTQTTMNGVKGYKVTGPNGNSIFLPFGGCSYNGATYGTGSYAYYWSGTLDGSNNQKAHTIYVKSGSGATSIVCQRRTGILIRPVKGNIEKAQPQTVDLGIGTKWASFNVGATSAEDYGSMFAWGETTTKSSYRWSNYTHANGTAASVMNIGYDISNTKYDVASQEWGDGWRLPTKQELQTLKSKCTFTLTTVNGIKGYKVTGPNGNSIFLPLGGCSYDGKDYGKDTYTYYWSGTLDDSNIQKANTLYLKSGSGASLIACQRRTGIYVRPVKGDKEDSNPEYVDLGLSTKWATCNVGASSPEESGNLYAWGETTTKASYKWSNYTYANGTASSMVYIGSSICGSQYDAATQKLGSMWRMPTQADITELRTKCTFTATTVNGVKGYTVKGPNGNSIFLPFAGCSYDGKTYGKGTYAFYWSGTLSNDNSKAKALYVKDGSGATVSDCQRRTGIVIRPVYKKSSMQVTQIDGINDNTETENDDVFTLSGIKVDSDHLKPGVYVRNGKKFVVK